MYFRVEDTVDGRNGATESVLNEDKEGLDIYVAQVLRCVGVEDVLQEPTVVKGARQGGEHALVRLLHGPLRLPKHLSRDLAGHLADEMKHTGSFNSVAEGPREMASE